ncbi:HlyD family secretion protein [Roseisolibacter sp. H3M3-2]|uniref:HlyD family efflux transporter periplasmic adaptor subunit n=1 Tax=Roseisolibacter sp. H3M3-2 TaxID=3031323 RepID=UPI0023DACA9F|nr:HlyD family secretion protein [Roseisolibacter sp. H3M3-2]MDF1502208.1 HlyD family efflux transporter periplasmic adaptor subunit [Roseisolibacter sp. H3M3-2]
MPRRPLTAYFNTTFARLGVCVVTVVALASVAIDRLMHTTSLDAVVNAPRVDVVAPVEGTIVEVAARPGEAVAAGAAVALLRRAEWTQGVDQEAGARLAQLRARVVAVDTQAGTLRRLRWLLKVRVMKHQASTVAQLDEQVRCADAAAAEHRAAQDRLAALVARNGATQAEVDRARAERAAADGQLARVKEMGDAARGGVLTDFGAQDVSYSQQRIDELTVQIAALERESALAHAELDALAARLGPTFGAAADSAAPSAGRGDAATLPADVSGTVAVPSAVRGVVWSVPHAPGSLVMKGAVLATLVDCADVYLEARVSPRDEAGIEPGMPVRFRFAGASDEMTGRVAYVRGGAVRDEAATVARLATEARAAADARVVITPDRGGFGAAPANFCRVGRSAKVRFGGGRVETAPAARALSWLRRAVPARLAAG